MKSQLTIEETAEIAARGYADPGFFCRTFLSEWFSLPMPWVHRGLLALLTKKTDWLLNFGPETWAGGEGEWTEDQLDKILRHFVWRPEPDDPQSVSYPLFQADRDENGKIVAIHLSISARILVIMPRGMSKTTLVNAANIIDIVYQMTNFLVYLSETSTHSEMQLTNVKRQLETNQLILLVFGPKKPDRGDGKWRDEFIETVDGCAVTARGRGGQVRGLLHDGRRPSKIVFDDVEDKESVKTQAQRDKCLNWLKADVEPALPQIGEGAGSIIGTGTILDSEALLITLMKDPEWITVIFGAVDPDGDMLWEHYMTRNEFERKKQSFIRVGKLAEFNREYCSSLKAEGAQAKFPQESIRYEILARADFPAVALVVDPAIGQKKDSDYIAYGVVGMSDKGHLHVFECILKQGLSPREQVDTYFELVAKWRPTKLGVEAVAYQKALVHLIREEQFRKSKEIGMIAYFNVIPILHGNTAKIPRVNGVLSPRYTAGYVTHQRRFSLLEQQLLEWPNGKKDGPDVIAMCVTLLDPHAAFALPLDEEHPGQDQLAKDQYPPIEEVLGGKFGSAP